MVKLQAPLVPSSHTHPNLQAAATCALSWEHCGPCTGHGHHPADPGPLTTPCTGAQPHHQMVPFSLLWRQLLPSQAAGLWANFTALPHGCSHQLLIGWELPGPMHSGAWHRSGQGVMGGWTRGRSRKEDPGRGWGRKQRGRGKREDDILLPAQFQQRRGLRRAGERTQAEKSVPCSLGTTPTPPWLTARPVGFVCCHLVDAGRHTALNRSGPSLLGRRPGLTPMGTTF